MERKSFNKKQENLMLIVPEALQSLCNSLHIPPRHNFPLTPLLTFISTVNHIGFSRFGPCPGKPFPQAGEVIGVDGLAGFYILSMQFTICKICFFKREVVETLFRIRCFIHSLSHNRTKTGSYLRITADQAGTR
jgi:hypothetical protein